MACTPAAVLPGASPSTASVSATASAAATLAPTPTAAPSATPSTTPTAIGLPTFVQLAAAGNGVVWALVAGTRLFHSADRGVTWTEQSPPAQGQLPNPLIAFVSGTEGWLGVGGSPATQCQVQGIDIYRTRDGATTWEKLAPTGIAGAQCKNWIGFSDTQHGYLTTWDPNAPPRVYATSDGGSTWRTSLPIPDPPGYTTRGAGVTLRGNVVADFVAVLFLDAFGFSANGGQIDYVFRSTDRGATWSYAAIAPQSVPVVFITTTHWIQLVSGDLSRETTDGGASWHVMATDYSQAAPVAPQVVFGDQNTGYATVRGSIQRTTDGGAHWTGVKTPGT
jgi:photosystem II stability/assembly factor-like uncharacterized protein